MTQLTAEGWEVGIYTTSYRSPRHLRWLFRLYGIRLGFVVNQATHEREVGLAPSKNPAAFGINLHVDDSDGVRLEGLQHGFAVVVVDPGDVNWTETVLAASRGIGTVNHRIEHDQ
jgi:hypothetical protein